MKQILLLIAIATISTAQAQVQGKSAPKPVAPPLLKNLNDSFSYSLGVQVASFYKQQGVKKINATMLAKAINDIYSNKKALLSQNDMDLSIIGVTSPEECSKIKATIAEGERFLKENKKRAEVKTTNSGLEYEILTQGTGEKPTLKDTVVCHYRGSFLNGSTFDESYSKNIPATFSMTGIIKGWTEALQLMPVGSKYKLYLPYDLGYGIMDYGSIPGGSALIFEVELLEIKKTNQ